MKIKKTSIFTFVLAIVLVFALTVGVLSASAVLASNEIFSKNPVNQANQNNCYDMSKFSNSDTRSGVTMSIESVYGGTDTVFVKLKVETDDIVFDDNFEYSFLRKIDLRSNSNDIGKNLINGGSQCREADKELWTEHIRYYDIKMSVMHSQRIRFNERADFSLGDGQERLMGFESFGYTNENYEWVKLIEDEWKLKFSYYTDDMDIDVLFQPFMFYGKGLEGHDRLAEMTSIKFNKYGMECRYTAYEVREAIDFTANLILKDGTKITLIKGSSACGINMEGFMIFKTESAIDVNEVAHIQIGDEIIFVGG
jgi:hypothetical protein